jgi:SAM-dependent methyltransferase
MTAEIRGTKQETDALQGRGVLQSPEEWNARNRYLSESIINLINQYTHLQTGHALDVGCEDGTLTDCYIGRTNLQWWGIDPDIPGRGISPCGAELLKANADDLPFEDGYFDCITFANVYEHISPEQRIPSLKSFFRVLANGGILVGQLPNPYFPIESHSRLPFFGYFPKSIQRYYWKLSPTGWNYENAHFFSVTANHLRKTAKSAGFCTELIRNYNYPLDVIPKDLRWAAKIHSRLGLFPWSWQFVFRK